MTKTLILAAIAAMTFATASAAETCSSIEEELGYWLMPIIPQAMRETGLTAMGASEALGEAIVDPDGVDWPSADMKIELFDRQMEFMEYLTRFLVADCM